MVCVLAKLRYHGVVNSWNSLWKSWVRPSLGNCNWVGYKAPDRWIIPGLQDSHRHFVTGWFSNTAKKPPPDRGRRSKPAGCFQANSRWPVPDSGLTKKNEQKTNFIISINMSLIIFCRLFRLYVMGLSRRWSGMRILEDIRPAFDSVGSVQDLLLAKREILS